MALKDKQLIASDKQNLAQVVGTYLSDKSIDMLVGGTDALGNSPLHDRGRGRPLYVNVQVTTTFTSGGGATLQVNLIYADDAALTVNVVILESSPVIPFATLVAGYRFRFGSLPPGLPGTATGRYVGFQYVVAGATITAGNILASLDPDLPSNFNEIV